MPRSPTLYSLPPGTTPQQPNTVIQSATWNAAMDDIAQAFNTTQPPELGGTGGVSLVNGSDQLNTRGTTIASAGTTNLTLATGNILSVTGTATITSFGSGAIPIGSERTIIFDAAATVVHSAAIVLPGSVNILIRSGDVMIVRYEGAGNWRCTGFLRRDIPVADLIGTWTPTITASSGTFTSVTATGTYTRIADRVLFNMTINIVTAGTASGNIIATLPFTAISGISAVGANVGTGQGAIGIAVPGSTISIVASMGGSVIAGPGVIFLSGQYRV